MLGRLVIGVIGFSVVLAMFMMVFADMRTTYNPTVDGLFDNATANFNGTWIYSMQNDTVDIAEKGLGLGNTTLNPSQTPENQFWSSSLSTLRIIPNSFGLITNIAYGVADYLGVPQWLVIAFLSVIIVMIVFTIISAVLRGSIF